MRVHYEARGGRQTARFRVDFEGAELEALADLANVITGDHDALGRALARAAREWRADNDPQGVLTSVPSMGRDTAPIERRNSSDGKARNSRAARFDDPSVPGDGHVVSHAPISNGGSPE